VLAAFGAPALVEQTALAEVTRHPIPKRDHRTDLLALQNEGLVLAQKMNRAARDIFRELTSRDLTGGLDDGEAATIAHAITCSENAIPVIDERKAIRIFEERRTGRTAIETLVLFTHARVKAAFLHEELAEAIFQALFHARMRVPSDCREWVVQLIGPDRACQCPSLGLGRHK
jgi:hypothetical protein